MPQVWLDLELCWVGAAQCHEIKSRSCQESWWFVPLDVSDGSQVGLSLYTTHGWRQYNVERVLRTNKLTERLDTSTRLLVEAQQTGFGCSAWKMLLDWKSSTDEQTDGRTTLLTDRLARRGSELGCSSRKRCSFEPCMSRPASQAGTM